MTRNEVFERMTQVFRDVFDDNSITIKDDTSSSDIVEWDSLMHIQLIDAIQDEFEVEFGIEEAYNLKNVGELVSLVMNSVNK